VDKGLKDEWLEKLNAFANWKPYSTCEGHVRSNHGGAEDHPRVWLETERAPNDLVADVWRDHTAQFQTMREKHFPAADTTSELHLNYKSPLFGTNFVLKLDSRFKRCSIEPSSEILGWWENTILRMQRFDHEFGQVASNDI
jgi:hypothetical protein